MSSLFGWEDADLFPIWFDFQVVYNDQLEGLEFGESGLEKIIAILPYLGKQHK